MQLLSSALSAAATRAAELVGGGAALLFAVLPGEAPDGPPRLRAAAGFASHDDAREAAASDPCVAHRSTHHEPVAMLTQDDSADLARWPVEQ